MSFPFAENPAKRAVERFWLWYTPVWGAASAVVMLGGFAERWEDVECLLYGIALAAPAAIGPIVLRPAEDRHLAWHQSTAFKMGLGVTAFACGLNYTQTPFFYDVLHMHYGFHTDWNIRNNPFFLYLVSVAYFSTYWVLVSAAFRGLRARLGAAGKWMAYLLAPLSMAFLETALNANPFMKRLFCYDDMPFMLWFGTLSYGVAFMCALPMWISIDETSERRVPVVTVLIWVCAVLLVDLLMLDVLRYHVAPHFTEVVDGANGLRDFATSCLEQAP